MRSARSVVLGPVLGGVAIAATSAGCFTTWAVSRAVGGPPWEEGVREEVVPLPGVTERLTVALPLPPPAQAASGTASGTATGAASGTATGAASGTATGAPPMAEVMPFALQCTTRQEGTDSVYHSGTVHGRKWKIATAMAAVVEGASGAVFLLATRNDADAGTRFEGKLYGGFLTLDAIGSAVLFLLPRREVVRTDQRVTVTPVRADCPDGLTLDVGGDSFVIDAAGRIGELGDVALAAWMQQPAGPLLVSFDGRSVDLRVGPAEQCAWQRARDPGKTSACAIAPSTRPAQVVAVFDVPVGSLSGPPVPPSE